jgi:hypothetical protein
MKNIIYRGILLLALLVSFFRCFGQSDSTLIKEKKLDFVNDKFKERTSMFYLAGRAAIENMDYQFLATNGLYTAYEHKLHTVHAIGAGMGYFLGYQNADLYYNHGYVKLVRVDLSYKYYHNLKLRMSKGLTGNNFSANYIYVSPNCIFMNGTSRISGYTWDFTNGYWVIKTKKEVICEPRLKLGYGFQRTIRNKLNFDLNAGFQLGNNLYQYQYHPGQLLFGQVTVGFIIK